MRASVRATTYRGQQGWTVAGSDSDGRKVRVFFEHETAARRYAEIVRSTGDSTTNAETFIP